MRECRVGSEEHRLAVKTALERHKQFCTVLMNGRTTEQIADDCAGVWTTEGDAHNVVWTGVRPEDEMYPPKLEWSQRLR